MGGERELTAFVMAVPLYDSYPSTVEVAAYLYPRCLRTETSKTLIPCRPTTPKLGLSMHINGPFGPPPSLAPSTASTPLVSRTTTYRLVQQQVRGVRGTARGMGLQRPFSTLYVLCTTLHPNSSTRRASQCSIGSQPCTTAAIPRPCNPGDMGVMVVLQTSRARTSIRSGRPSYRLTFGALGCSSLRVRSPLTRGFAFHLSSKA